jgi:D-amino peptidase
MKIYISADIEGVTGTCDWDETLKKSQDYQEFRDQMTAEVVAACEGALQAGATDLWVKDAHDTGRNLIASRLPPQAHLVRGWSGHPFCMVQELDHSFHAVIMVGYHSRAGTNTSPLAHTMSTTVAEMTINGQAISEFLLHSYAAAYVGVPVVFVAGDAGICTEVATLNQHIRTVAVKQGIGNSIVSIHPTVALEKIRTGVEAALRNDFGRCAIPLPPHFTVMIRYRDHMKAYKSSFFPGVELRQADTIAFNTDNYFEVLRLLLFTV